jgi:hypothetical protein
MGRTKHTFTNDQLVEIGQMIATENGGTLTVKAWNESKLRPVARSTVELRFGSWAEFCHQVGAVPAARLTDEQLVELGRQLYADAGQLSIRIWDESQMPVTSSCVIDRFGRFSIFARQCGALTTRERIIEWCVQRVEAGEGVPSSDSWDQLDSPCSAVTVYNQLGSWPALREEVAAAVATRAAGHLAAA